MNIKIFPKGSGEQLSANFKAYEFDCPCDDCTETKIDLDLVEILQKNRDHFGKPISPNAYRCPKHNAETPNAAKASKHMLGCAADFSIDGVTPLEIAAFNESIGVKGIGLYDTFVHVDTRTSKAFWYSHTQEYRETFGGTTTKGETNMAVKIGHASIDENGKARKGSAGDQTTKEVCTRNWYNKPWTAVIRPLDSAVAEKIARAMEQACANDKIGYDQYQRTTLYTKAKAAGWDLSKITEKCECDCSSLVAVCVNAAGITVSKDIYTGNQMAALKATGAFEVLTASKYTGSSTYLKRGDILLGSGHTAITLSDGGGATNTKSEEACKVNVKVLRKGSEGECVKALQILLISYGYSCGKSGTDGVFGSATDNAVECFQEDNGLTVDGVVGAKTWAKLLGV